MNITDFRKKKSSIAVIGLGYVGLPIAIEFAKKFKVVGFDIKEERVNMMKQKIDPSQELDSSAFENIDMEFTSKIEDIKDASFYIVAVPTPINSHNHPDLTPVINASETVGNVLSKGDYVVYESTVYPGCTEEDCVPVLEKQSNLKFGKDFKVGYSPERINPGDKKHTLTKIVKIVSGCDDESLELISSVYSEIIEAGVHKARSMKVAEAAKIIENTQRDVNIALMNELSIIFGRMGINTYDVLEAAGTKWNFLRFHPGLVGGHCIGVDPYYLTYQAQTFGYHPKIINSGRYVNDSMGGYVAKMTIKQMIAKDKNIKTARVLIMGATFKENVSDIRNSKVVDIIRELNSFGVQPHITDPYADPEEIKEEFGIELTENPSGPYDAIIITVKHEGYATLDESFFGKLAANNAVIVDLKGTYRNKIRKIQYWSL
jgi:UDP-N-acetyl-D-glucosamine/UDP-N-acetyl-D-galactosamine dehydrogenase